MPEEPPDRTQTYNFLSRQQLEGLVNIAVYALQKRASGKELNGEIESVRTFCTDIRNKFRPDAKRTPLRNTLSIDHIQNVINAYNERRIDGNEFPARTLEFISGLEKIQTMTADEALRYERALGKFDQSPKY